MFKKITKGTEHERDPKFAWQDLLMHALQVAMTRDKWRKSQEGNNSTPEFKIWEETYAKLKVVFEVSFGIDPRKKEPSNPNQ